MLPNFEFLATPPNQLGTQELNAFVEMVKRGDEVTAIGLEGRVAAAASLLRVYKNDLLCAVGAVKHPNQGYRDGVFGKAKASQSPAQYELELGWIFVSPSCRGNGLSRQLVAQAVAELGTRKIYATSRSDNAAMHKSLIAAGFVSSGSDYLSNNQTKKIRLFCR